MILHDFMYKITTDVTKKTMYIVNIGFAVLSKGPEDCISISIDGYIPTGIACHEIKMTCIVN